MQRLPNQLVPTAQLSTSAAAYYTAPTLTVADISSATATNVTNGTAAITVYLVPSGGSPTAANTIVQSRNVPPNASVQLWELIGQKVLPGSSIQAQATSATSINLSVGGYEIVS
jgi:hypothetical protein